jgi:hypothetical protein
MPTILLLSIYFHSRVPTAQTRGNAGRMPTILLLSIHFHSRVPCFCSIKSCFTDSTNERKRRTHGSPRVLVAAIFLTGGHVVLSAPLRALVTRSQHPNYSIIAPGSGAGRNCQHAFIVHTVSARLSCTLSARVYCAHCQHAFIVHTVSTRLSCTLSARVYRAHCQHAFIVHTVSTRLSCTLSARVYRAHCQHALIVHTVSQQIVCCFLKASVKQ